MQFQVLVSFFFTYIAAVQASPIGVPETTIPELPVVGAIKAPDDIPVNAPINVRAIPSLPLDVVSKLPVSVPVPRNIPDTLEGVGKTLEGATNIVVESIPFEVNNALSSVVGRQLDLPIKDAAEATVDGTAYALHAGAKSALKSLDSRKLGEDLPAAPSTEGVAPALKAPEVPTVPTLPLKTRQVDVPKVDIPKVDDITSKVSSSKMVRRYVRRRESGCADAPTRRSLDGVAVPPVPALKGVEVPSTPFLPIN